MPQMSRYYIELSILQSKVISDTAFITNHVVYGALCYLSGPYI